MKKPEEMELTKEEQETEDAVARAFADGSITRPKIDPATIDAAADATLRKDQHLNIRIAASTKDGLKARAARRGDAVPDARRERASQVRDWTAGRQTRRQCYIEVVALPLGQCRRPASQNCVPGT